MQERTDEEVKNLSAKFPLAIGKQNCILTESRLPSRLLLFALEPIGGGIVTLSSGFPPLASAKCWKPAESGWMAHGQLQLRLIREYTTSPVQSECTQTGFNWTGWKGQLRKGDGRTDEGGSEQCEARGEEVEKSR